MTTMTMTPICIARFHIRHRKFSSLRDLLSQWVAQQTFIYRNSETLAHLLKGCLGTGILAMHQAFHNSGWLSGVINMAIIGFICTYCFHILVKSQYILCKKHRVPLLSYPDSMKYALEQGPGALRWIAPSAVLITDGFLIIYQLGVCICYIVFVAKNIHQVSLINLYLLVYWSFIEVIIVLDSWNVWHSRASNDCNAGHVFAVIGT